MTKEKKDQDKGKPVRDVDQSELGPKTSSDKKVAIEPGNIPTLTVQLLNNISMTLNAILEELKKNNG